MKNSIIVLSIATVLSTSAFAAKNEVRTSVEQPSENYGIFTLGYVNHDLELNNSYSRSVGAFSENMSEDFDINVSAVKLGYAWQNQNNKFGLYGEFGGGDMDYGFKTDQAGCTGEVCTNVDTDYTRIGVFWLTEVPSMFDVGTSFVGVEGSYTTFDSEGYTVRNFNQSGLDYTSLEAGVLYKNELMFSDSVRGYLDLGLGLSGSETKTQGSHTRQTTLVETTTIGSTNWYAKAETGLIAEFDAVELKGYLAIQQTNSVSGDATFKASRFNDTSSSFKDSDSTEFSAGVELNVNTAKAAKALWGAGELAVEDATDVVEDLF